MADCYEPCNTEIEICVNTGPSGPRGSVGKITQFIFYPAVGATDITGTDKSGTLLEVDPDGCLVALNGVMLEPTVDYSIAADGLTVTLSEAIVNANDVLTVQTWKTDEESSNAVLDLKLDVEKNTQDISGIDVRVTANEEGIQELQDLAGGVTTRNVKVSGVNTVRSVDQKLENQQDVNLYLDSNLADLQTKVSSLTTDQGGTSQDLEVIREDIAGNAKGVSDNSEIISDLTDKVSDNVDDITSLQSQVNKLPPPTDISELEKDVDDIALAVGGNTVSISKNAQDIAVLGSPPDLTDLNESVALNAAGISKNANDVKDIKAVDAGQSMSIADLQADVVELQATEFDTTGLAVIDADNQFTASQSIQDGVKITGEKAFLEMDKGTALTVSNGNFSNSVIDIMRSNGEIALSFEASGHIRGVKTDAADGSSAVSVDYLTANGGSGGDADLSDYATKLALADEERARILGDQALAKDLQDAIDTEKYDDQEVRNLISKTDQDSKSADTSLSSSIEFEARYREEADDNLQDQIDNISVGGGDVNLDAYVSKVELAGFGYATEVYVNAVIADFATENFVTDAIGAIPEVSLEGYATEEFVTNAIDAIEFPEDVDLTPYDERITQNTDDLTDLKQDLKIIEGEVGSIVSSKEEGDWKFNGASSSAAESGSFSKLPNNLLTEGGAFTFNTSDLSGEVHTFLEAEAGDDLEIYSDENNYGIFKIVSVSGEGSLRQIDTESLRGKGRLTNNDVARLKIFNISGIPANLDELDDRYVSLTGDTMTGNLIAKRLTARDATGTAVCLVEGRMENDTAASRITLSNKINGAAFGQISWHGQDENGWLEINKDVDFKEKELRGISSLQMTGALQAPRIDIKNADDTAWLTVQGFTDQQIVPASGIALYNSEFDKEFGGIEWYYNGNYGALHFNQDIHMEDTRSVRNLYRLDFDDAGYSAITEGDKERITFGGKVEIQKAGDAGVDGFVIRGRTPKGIDEKLLSVFHNSTGNDAVNYEGRQDGPTNIVTNKWVDAKIAAIGSNVHYGLVSFKAHAQHIADGYERCWWATDADGNGTTGTGDIASIYYHVPAGHYILRSIGTTDIGEIMIFNDGFDLRYHAMATKTSIKDNIIKIDVDSKEEGSGSMAYGGLFTLDMMNCFRETSAIKETEST